MSVLLETSLGDIVIDLHVKQAPIACTNFLKLCKLKRYNYSLFHTITQGFTAQTGGDCTGDVDSGASVWSFLGVSTSTFFAPEINKRLKLDKKGVVAFVCAAAETTTVAKSQFFFTLSDSGAEYLNGTHAVFGQVVEGLEVLDALNTQLVDESNRPFRDIRIKHTIILDDPFPDPPNLCPPSRSPSPPPQLLASSRIAEDENLFPDVDPLVLEKESRDREAAARALTLEMIGDLPFADVRPPENILFVCKLNPVTKDEDLEIIFSRFGEIRSCEIIRDKKTQDSLCYAFIDFESKESAEEAYFKMDNVLIDDRRIHVDFSQSVSKLHADFLVGNRRHLDAEEGGEFGGKGLQRRRQYRDDVDERGDMSRNGRDGEGGDGRDGDRRRRYDLVFDHDGSTLDKEKKRIRRDADDDVRDDNKKKDKKDDERRNDVDGKKDSRSGREYEKRRDDDRDRDRDRDRNRDGDRDGRGSSSRRDDRDGRDRRDYRESGGRGRDEGRRDYRDDRSSRG
ncbi:UNVERIFIED_CONTAM: Peptidyl-prolyl cis-trans isomerase cyp6 [Siphonaria sp. JEL0065]|nr:Peptidyl-prolyl cis-trans isomerase cyp6 [Siphonaria sp. JEL0065]